MNGYSNSLQKILLSTGYYENYWGKWPWVPQMGGSEWMVYHLALQFADLGHDVTVRLPYKLSTRVVDGVRWVGLDTEPEQYDINFAFDQYDRYDPSLCRILVACRSDPPRHDNFDEEIFLSDTHRRHCGRPNRPFIGGGVRLGDYAKPVKRLPNTVIYISSPDRGLNHAVQIARGRQFVASYKPIPGYPKSGMLDRPQLVSLQHIATVAIFPIDPIRPSEFFCMAALECMAAMTPVILSDADCLPELWGGVAPILPRPIDYAEWSEAIDNIDPELVKLAHLKAQDYSWSRQAQRYLNVASALKYPSRGLA